jgi:hypothetical protein
MSIDVRNWTRGGGGCYHGGGFWTWTWTWTWTFGCCSRGGMERESGWMSGGFGELGGT